MDTQTAYDELLLTDFKSLRASAISHFYFSVFDKLTAHNYAITGDRYAAKDLTIEAYCNAMRLRGSFDAAYDIFCYLLYSNYQMAQNWNQQTYRQELIAMLSLDESAMQMPEVKLIDIPPYQTHSKKYEQPDTILETRGNPAKLRYHLKEHFSSRAYQLMEQLYHKRCDIGQVSETLDISATELTRQRNQIFSVLEKEDEDYPLSLLFWFRETLIGQ